MIMRIWRGVVPASKAKEYQAYQEEVGPPGYLKIPGNRGVYMIGRTRGANYELAMVTLWDSWDAIRAFAGEPVEKAKYYERDFDYLIDPPDTVEHYEVLAAHAPES